MPRDEMLTIAEVLAELKISRPTFYRWRALEKGPKCVTLPGGRVRVKRSALDLFLADCA
jgi:excisionase family DNA binding protein